MSDFNILALYFSAFSKLVTFFKLGRKTNNSNQSIPLGMWNRGEMAGGLE